MQAVIWLKSALGGIEINKHAESNLYQSKLKSALGGIEIMHSKHGDYDILMLKSALGGIEIDIGLAHARLDW